MGQVAPEEQLRILKSGVVDLHVETELLALLRKGKPLCIKAGFDPTRPDLHLGHTVLMNKMRQFQMLGHNVVFVVGDFTAQIGDPSGRNATRKVPTREEIVEGARTYAEQAFKILDKDRTRVVYNSEWLGKMGFDDVIRLAGRYTLARMMERDDFKKRWTEHQSISLHELLYPLAQAQDSVHLDADVELGGTDQLFNLMVGREIMRECGQRPQVVMTTPILEGLSARVENGKLIGEKMSKSLDNYVGVAESAGEQYGKLMSISDALMWRYYELLSTVDPADVKSLKASCDSGATNPKAAKSALAKEIVARYHDAAAADSAFEAWEKQFSRREVPDDMPEVHVAAEGDSIWLPKAMTAANLATGTSDARRKIEAGAVDVDGERVSDVKAVLKKGAQYVVKAGKRAWAKISVT
ncbi:MAG: tyrosine--tRNA ligase [Sandaracinaceae bacterium]|nr:tyrosine--tRNA ligase [Sandaracinaceae bacterium]